MRAFARIVTLVMGVTVLSAVPASAITFGEPDDTNRFPNVGSMVVEFEGERFSVCTGTLIASDVFLTAGHCTIFAETESLPTFVSFDAEFDPAAAHLPGTPVTHPRFGHDLGDLFDIGVIVLDEPVQGIDSAPLASLGFLSGLSSQELRDRTFTAVGYGATRNQKQGGPAGLHDGGTRMFVEQHVLSLTKAWVTFNQNPATGGGGTCFGDSGGPHFNAAGRIVAITSRGDSVCRATDKSYRVDTVQARSFLDDFLD